MREGSNRGIMAGSQGLWDGEVASRVYKTHASRFNSDRLHQAGIYHISATPEPLEPQSPVTPQALPATMSSVGCPTTLLFFAENIGPQLGAYLPR
jgi:hypothetical protein